MRSSSPRLIAISSRPVRAPALDDRCRSAAASESYQLKPKVGCAAGADGLALRVDQLRAALDLALGLLDAVDLLDRVDAGPGGSRARTSALVAGGDLVAADVDRDVLADGAEQVVEDLAEAVGEDERAGRRTRRRARSTGRRGGAAACGRRGSGRWHGSSDVVRHVHDLELLHPVQHRLGGRARPSRRRCGRRRGTARGRRTTRRSGSWVTITIVWSMSRHRPAQEAEHLGAAGAVEVAGRLVGEDDLRPAGQRAGAGDPLLLAAGELGRPVA